MTKRRAAAAILVLALSAGQAASAQQTTPAAPPAAAPQAATAPPSGDSNAEVFAFFTGRWSCAGEFASGRKIESEITFAPVLGGKWLEQQHTDRAPNQYQAVSMWGRDPLAGGRFLSTVHDNGGGVRRFVSEGWSGERLVLESDLPAEAPRRERFTYERKSGTTFRMEWLVSRDAGQTWRMGDWLLCSRES